MENEDDYQKLTLRERAYIVGYFVVFFAIWTFAIWTRVKK